MTAKITVEACDEILIVNTSGHSKEKNEDGTLKSSSSFSQTQRLAPGEKGSYSVYKGHSFSVRVANKYDLKPLKEDAVLEGLGDGEF